MEAERDDKTARGAAHERAVMNVRLTLLLLIIGVALLLFKGHVGVLSIFGGMSCG